MVIYKPYPLVITCTPRKEKAGTRNWSLMRIEGSLCRWHYLYVDVLTLVDESSLNKGLEALRRYVRENVEDSGLLMDRTTFTIGR